ncbi:MAG: 4Fe-4S binding protein [Bacillota bacterium]
MDLERVADALSRMTPVTARSTLCPRSRSNRSACSICVEVCPAGAITLDQTIDVSQCPACGLCATRCPAGVFEVQRPSDGSLVTAVRERARESPVVVLGCEKYRDRGPSHTLGVNCLGQVSAELLVAFVAAGARRIILLQDPETCASCGYSALQESVEAAVRRATDFLAAAGLDSRDVVIAARWEDPSSKRARGAWLPWRRGDRARPAEAADVDRSRRELFAAAWKETKQAPKAFLDTLLGREAEAPAAGSKVPGQTGLPPRRELLLKALAELAREHEGVLGAPVFQQRLSLQNGCTLCGVCSRLCPTGALTQVQAEDQLHLQVRADHCTGCGLCLDVCPEKALAWSNPLTAGELLQRAPGRLASSGSRTCAVCGQPYHNSQEEQTLCTRCRISLRFGGANPGAVN